MPSRAARSRCRGRRSPCRSSPPATAAEIAAVTALYLGPAAPAISGAQASPATRFVRFVPFACIEFRPQMLGARFLRLVHILRGDQPALDRPQRQHAADDHDRDREDKMDPERRIIGDLQPDDHESERKSDDTLREKGGAVVGRRKAEVESAILAAIGQLQPRPEHRALAAFGAFPMPARGRNPAQLFIADLAASHFCLQLVKNTIQKHMVAEGAKRNWQKNRYKI